MKVRLASPIEPDSIVDGEGIRAVIWAQGCSHNCLGCHNPKTHSFNDGYEVDVEEIKKELSKLTDHDGITLSGGDPMFQIEAMTEIGRFAHSIALSVWCFTGFTFEELLDMSKDKPSIIGLLKEIDVLVDGKFMLELKSFDYKYRGSSNQRIINVKDSLKKNRAVEIRIYKQKAGIK